MTEDPAKPEDFDPAAPGIVDAVRASNFGLETALTEASAPTHPPGTPATLPIDAAAARAFLQACMHSVPRVVYHLGDKVPFHGAVPGKDFKTVDCSGFVRELIFRATQPGFNFPDGSVVQRDWVKAQGFAGSSVADAAKHDGIVRIAFLSPHDTASHIGHVTIVIDGATLESHGGVGPDSRPWDGSDWQGQTEVFILHP